MNLDNLTMTGVAILALWIILISIPLAIWFDRYRVRHHQRHPH